MKIKLINLISAALIFICGFIGGCEDAVQLKVPDSVYWYYVNVSIEGAVLEKDSLTSSDPAQCTTLCTSFQVKITVKINAATRFEKVVITDNSCRFDAPGLIKLKVFVNETVGLHVASFNDIPGYKEHGCYSAISFSDISNDTDLNYGETLNWDPGCTMIIVPE
jgi:hypothetical protein